MIVGRDILSGSRCSRTAGDLADDHIDYLWAVMAVGEITDYMNDVLRRSRNSDTLDTLDTVVVCDRGLSDLFVTMNEKDGLAANPRSRRMTHQPEPQSEGLGSAGWDGPEPREPTDAELFGLWPNPFSGRPDEGDGWPGEVSDAELDGGFASGAPLDVLPPDEMLAAFAARAYDRGLGRLSDNELAGLLCAARRLCSWQAAVELAVIAELDGRRRAGAGGAGSSRVGEQVSAEVAAALTLTSRSADAMLCLARDLGRLPGVFAALFAGQIDRPKAVVFGQELAAVSDQVAAAIVMALISAAAGMTTGQLRAEIKALVLMFEPDAVRRRAERGREQARVETWQESSGNWGIAGRELPAADAITADTRLTAIARALKDAGGDGSLDQLRAAVLVALLTGRDPQTLLPPGPSPAPPNRADPATPAGPAGGRTSRGGIAGLTGTINLTMVKSFSCTR